MASPIGHALVGIGLAALAVPVAGVSPSPALWLGAVVASGLPDLDFIGTLFGLAPRRTHRGPSHSFLVLGLVALFALCLSLHLERLLPMDLVFVWSLVLFSHPVVDLMATGPQAAQNGFGLPLLWPLSTHRWYLHSPLVHPPSLEQYKSGKIWRHLLPEVFTFGPACLGFILLGQVL
jgi:membrane-bound metal-dependent hydrolase YbcI (DUF457 family)